MAAERYEMLERIATGGMAEVFRARAVGEHGFQKTLAVKRILPSLASDEEFVARFIAEAKLAVALTHTNIVQIFDLGRFAGSLYIAMEFVEGGDLAALLRACAAAGRTLPTSVALFVAIELAKGLDYAHRRAAQPVVHRDVSPSNILLSYAGEVKIADFGIAQALEQAGAASPRIMGKWRYMSPEQARGERLDERSDIFSAGAVMFEMFTGRKLVPGADADAIVKNLQGVIWPRPSELRAELPPELDAALGKAIARDPGDRYAHIEELMEALTEISYARSVRTSSLELAELVRELLPRAELDTTTSRRTHVIDDIIRSEIGAKEASARRTLAGSAAAAGDDRKTTALRARAPAVPGRSGAAFVPGEPDGRGITTWRVVGEDRGGRGKAALLVGLALLFVGVMIAVAAAERDRTRPPPAPPARPSATLVVQSEPPGAELTVDGRPTGLRTPVDGIPVPPGAHRIGLRLPGYLASESVQSFRARETVRLPILLEREPRVLTVGSVPYDASVKIDGVPRGVTPTEVTDLSPGTHEVQIELRGYDPFRQTVVVGEGGRLSVLPTLRESRRLGKVSLNANVWARVYVDGGKRPFCTTPCEGRPLEAGRHRLRFESPPLGQSVTRTVEVAAGKLTSITDVVIEKR